MHPVCNIYSSFMQRAYDNVIHDVALQNLPVTFCLDRGGLVGEDGATHHGVFDIAYFSCVPNMIVASPMNEAELRNMLYSAIETPSPYAIRYPRGCGVGVEWKDKPFSMITTGRGHQIKAGNDIAILTLGPVGNFAAKAIERIEATGKATIAHYDMRFAKPLDEELLHEVGKMFQKVITVEDGVLRGGIGESIIKFFNDNGYTVQVKTLGIEDRFIEHGTPAQLYALCGYDVDGIEKAINSMI